MREEYTAAVAMTAWSRPRKDVRVSEATVGNSGVWLGTRWSHVVLGAALSIHFATVAKTRAESWGLELAEFCILLLFLTILDAVSEARLHPVLGRVSHLVPALRWVAKRMFWWMIIFFPLVIVARIWQFASAWGEPNHAEVQYLFHIVVLIFAAFWILLETSLRLLEVRR